jgi:hypothetical protein
MRWRSRPPSPRLVQTRQATPTAVGAASVGVGVAAGAAPSRNGTRGTGPPTAGPFPCRALLVGRTSQHGWGSYDPSDPGRGNLGGTPLVPCRLLRVLRKRGAAYEGEARSPRAVDRLIALASKALDESQGLIYTPRAGLVGRRVLPSGRGDCVEALSHRTRSRRFPRGRLEAQPSLR